MEFGEKLQSLRKSKGITQEEFARQIFVSRAAVSKWESGRGYPNIESLKEISEFFSVSIDALLSGDKLISIAQRENKENIRSICDTVFGIVDLFFLMLIVLPVYPDAVGGIVYSVSLIDYIQTSLLNRTVYWVMYCMLLLSGIMKLLIKHKAERIKKSVTFFSFALNTFAVVFLALTREAYAVVVTFLLLITKIMITFKAFKGK